MASELNCLLKQLDNLSYQKNLPMEAKIESCQALLKGIDTLFKNEDLEVNRDVFDGISNDMRRAVIAAFVCQLAESFAGAKVVDVLIGILDKVTKDTPPPSKEGNDPLGMSSLDKALRNQKNERN